MSITYHEFLERKTQLADASGFDSLWLPDFLFDFQKSLCDWAIRKGRAAIFADCGLGKTPMQLVWAENVRRHTSKPVLIITPLAVGAQTCREADKFGIEAEQSRDGHVAKNITVTNYERLHYFNPDDFAGCACDESSILKNYAGATRNAVIEFLHGIPYRLLCSATPSPNDYTELGNSVEALGVMRRVEMLSMFFVHDGGETAKWRLKKHGQKPFWRFVASWARAVKFPSDLGFENGDFILPELRMDQHTLKSNPMDGYLFPLVAMTLDEQRNERRQTIEQRCGMVADIANASNDFFIAWCSLNNESKFLKKHISGAVEITGSQSDDEKAEKMLAFSNGEIRCIVTKPGICGHGMNWQHCNQMSFFPSHSHEEFYQCTRRCWRFGQTRPVNIHIVTTEAESAVLQNLMAKERASEAMFAQIVENMRGFYSIEKSLYTPSKEIITPSWL